MYDFIPHALIYTYNTEYTVLPISPTVSSHNSTATVSALFFGGDFFGCRVESRTFNGINGTELDKIM